MMSSEPSLNRAGLSVLAFLDMNADGVRQRGEPPVVSAGVIVGNRVLTTNAEGRAYYWGAPAFEPILLTVDSLTVPPHWHAPAPVTAVLRGTRTLHVDLPLVAGSTLEGRILMNGGAVDVGSVSLWLQEENSASRQPVEVFRDGTFYIMSVRPGVYVLNATVRESGMVASQKARVLVPVMSSEDAQLSTRRLESVTLDLGASAQRYALPPCAPGVRCQK